MKIIKIKFEYNAFPVWIYDENNKLIANDLPEYLIGNSEIDPIFVNLQKDYNSLYSDTEKEFKYIGFKDETAENDFNKRVELAKINLEQLLTTDYQLI